jgi:hypothetical protein
MPPRKPISAPWIAAVVLLLLIGGYVGAYYATVTRYLEVANYPTITRFFPDGSHLAVRALFTPIHWLDRRIRPHVWNDADRHRALRETYKIPSR